MARRLSDPFMRSISTPNDYFPLGLLIVWLAFSLPAAPNRPETGDFPFLARLLVTAFFLVYGPGSMRLTHTMIQG